MDPRSQLFSHFLKKSLFLLICFSLILNFVFPLSSLLFPTFILSQGHILYDRQTSNSPNHLSHTYTALLTPRRTELSLLTLSQCGDNISTDLTIHDFGLEFVPLEKDLLSLEEGSHNNSNSNSNASTNGGGGGRGDAGFSRIFKDGDHTILHHSAMALMTLQLVYGLFPRILGKGEAGKVSRKRRVAGYKTMTLGEV